MVFIDPSVSRVGGEMKERGTEVTGQLVWVLKAETDTNIFHSL